MNISFENIDKVNGLLTMKVSKEDYEPEVTKSMKDFRKKAQLPGFRPGQVPMSILQKRFGNEVKAEELQKLVSKELFNYIREQKVNMLGEPLPNEEKQKPMDFTNDEEFEFVFDIALAPEMDATISSKDTVNYYDITVTDEMVNSQVEAYAQRNGQYEKVQEYQDNDMVKGLLAQLDENGNTLEGGIQVEEAVLLPKYMKNEDEKAKFADAKVNDVLVFNPANAYDNSEVELASLLKIEKEKAAEIKSNFSFQVNEITRYVPGKINQALFDSVLGEGVAKSEEEFRGFIRTQMQNQFEQESDFQFLLDLRKYLTERIGDLEFPEATLKRVMMLKNQEKDAEYVEKNFAGSLKELAWHLMKEQLCDQLGVKVEDNDIKEAAKEIARMQFAQYGMVNLPEDTLEKYATSMLQNEQQAEGLVARTVEKKIGQLAKNALNLNRKAVSIEEFNALNKPAE